MAGFGKIAVIGESYGQAIVNVFWYRSQELLPFQDDPFVSMQDVVDAWVAAHLVPWMLCHPAYYTLQRVDGTGYTDALEEVPGALATNTVQENGTNGGTGADSLGHTANITWICGPQHRISGLGFSKRNRGTTSIGPVPSTAISDDGHFTGVYVSTDINNCANSLRQTFVSISDFATAIPIVIHGAYIDPVPPLTHPTRVGTTYSDILGYRLPTVTGFRRSRLPERV